MNIHRSVENNSFSLSQHTSSSLFGDKNKNDTHTIPTLETNNAHTHIHCRYTLGGYRPCVLAVHTVCSESVESVMLSADGTVCKVVSYFNGSFSVLYGTIIKKESNNNKRAHVKRRLKSRGIRTVVHSTVHNIRRNNIMIHGS